jgi:hypothetical protein
VGKKKFFKRGYASLGWRRIIRMFPTVAYVAVDYDGDIYAYSSIPHCGDDYWFPKPGAIFQRIGKVGEDCEDWKCLLFERPAHAMLQPGFWEAVDVLIGKDASFVAMDDDGEWWIFRSPPSFHSPIWCTDDGGFPLRIPGVSIDSVEAKDSYTARPNLIIGEH